jgi:Xaa-Pro aminopeptidase
MAPTHPQLTASLDEAGTDGYLIDADGEDSNQYYLSRYYAPDDFVTLYTDGAIRLLVSGLEYTRAISDSDGDSVRELSEFDYADKITEYGRTKAGPLATAAFLSEYEIDSVSVPISFPTGTADVLRDQGIEIATDYDDAMSSVRAVKTDEEIEYIAESQRANEEAMAVVEGMLERATAKEGIVRLEGEVLTSERVRRVIEATLLEEDCESGECIGSSLSG